jgi:GxxExxY protein
MNHVLNIHRGDAEARSFDELTERIIGSCIEIHRELGPGLLESAYEACLCHELARGGLDFERQKQLPITCKGVNLDCGYKLDVVVGGKIVVELKTVDEIMPIHEAQILTYLKLSRLPVGLLINFNVPMLKQGIKRIVNKLPEKPTDSSAPPRLRV